MSEKLESYNIIKDKIHAIKEEYPSLKNKSDDFAFSALAVKAMYYKNPALTLSDTDINDIIVDGKFDGGVDFLLSDPNSEASDLIIGQSKFYQDIKFEDAFSAISKMLSFYKDMKAGHYENVNVDVQSQFLTLNAEIGEESKIHFVFITSAKQNRIRRDRLNKLIKDYFPDTENIDLIVQFADDIVESIKELESRRPTVESGKLKIDEAGNCLYYGDDAVIVNISAFSLKSLYAQYNNNVLSKNLRYHVPGGGIDKAIEDTIRDYPEDFWFKNNGITIICSSFRLDGKEVKLKDFSIINGGQTTYMIHKSKNVSEELNFYLPCKIIKTIGDTEDDKSNFILEIAKATNSQKAIKKVDLKANSPEQVRFAQAMRQAGVFYQTKRGESVPKEYKETYKNSDLSEVGKLCLSAIFQMPGASRNKPSTLYEPPYYEFIFDGDQKKISNIVKELLYIDNYWKKEFKAQYEKETRNSPNYTDMLPFANNSRIICIAFVMLASRYYSGNLDANDINTIYNGKKSDSAKNEYNEVCEKLEGVDSVLPKGTFDNKNAYDQILHDLFLTIINFGYANYNNSLGKEDGINATNYLKKDESYYNILKSNWYMIDREINFAFSKMK